MNTGRDEDALRWDGDDDPTLDVGTRTAGADPTPDATGHDGASGEDAPPLALPDGFTAVGKDSDTVGHIEADGTVVMPGDKAPLSSPMLITLGILAGVYLLFTIGWIVGGLRLQPLASFLVSDVMFLPWFVLAIAAPALWFLASWVLTRGRAAWIRVAVLLAGVVLLVPWPFVTGGVIGS